MDCTKLLTSDHPTMNLPKGLILAHLNICSLRNKIHELETLLKNNSIHIMAVTETHLDDSFDDSLISMNDFFCISQGQK